MRTLLITAIALSVFAGGLEAQLRPGSIAPEIEARDWFHDPPGTSLADLRGSVVYIEFWATW